MDIFKVCAVALICICAATFLKQTKADLLPSLRVTAITVLTFSAILAAEPIVSYVRTLAQMPILSAHAETLMKAVGLSILAQCCAELCRECGENGIANGVETVGKIQLLLLSLPLLEEVFTMASQLLDLGGTS